MGGLNLWAVIVLSTASARPANTGDQSKLSQAVTQLSQNLLLRGVLPYLLSVVLLTILICGQCCGITQKATYIQTIIYGSLMAIHFLIMAILTGFLFSGSSCCWVIVVKWMEAGTALSMIIYGSVGLC